jgi:hypothetical protein
MEDQELELFLEDYVLVNSELIAQEHGLSIEQWISHVFSLAIKLNHSSNKIYKKDSIH